MGVGAGRPFSLRRRCRTGHGGRHGGRRRRGRGQRGRSVFEPRARPLRERLNAVILSMREDGAIDTIIDRWLGTAE